MSLLSTILSLIFAFTVAILANASPVNPVSNTSKAGLAWPNGPDIDIQPFLETGKVSWYYSWTPETFDDKAPIEFVPMFWGNKSIDDWVSSINQTIASKSVTAALGMNEPQETGQSNLTPQEGADLWKTYLEPLRSLGIRLGSPAPSSAPSGKTWLQDFLTACAGGCTVDFIALHWYDVNATKFMNYLNDFYDTFQRPIWVTEWACQNFNDFNAQCSYDDVVLFLNTTQSFMDQALFVERYAWFGAMEQMQGVNPDDALMTSDGHINDLGKQYIGSSPPMTVEGGGSPNGPSAQPDTSAANLLNVSANAGLIALAVFMSTVFV